MEITKENFNKSEFNNILDSTNLIFQNISNNIKNQEQKKTKLIAVQNEFSKLNDVSINEDEKKYLEELISSLSSNILQLENNLSEIEQIKLSFSNEDSINVENLKNKISSFSSELTLAETAIIRLDSEIDLFIKKLNTKNSSITSITNDFFENDIHISDNHTLVISEKENCVFLPYTISELNSYLELYPKDYNSLSNVVNKEFILPLDYYTKHPSFSRFREAYSLIRDKEAKSVFEALKYSSGLMFKYDLNPAIISACKTEEALNHYIECLDNDKLHDFDLFKIEYKINPIAKI